MRKTAFVSNRVNYHNTLNLTIKTFHINNAFNVIIKTNDYNKKYTKCYTRKAYKNRNALGHTILQ